MEPVKWSGFYLYVILDIDRRRVTGWRVEPAESASQFKVLFIDAMAKHAARQTALDAAFLSTRERLVRQRPKPPQIPTAVWINPPMKTEPAQA